MENDLLIKEIEKAIKSAEIVKINFPVSLEKEKLLAAAFDKGKKVMLGEYEYSIISLSGIRIYEDCSCGHVDCDNQPTKVYYGLDEDMLYQLKREKFSDNDWGNANSCQVVMDRQFNCYSMSSK